MDPSNAMRSVVGLIITIMNIIAVVVLLRCKKMAFQIRIFTLQLAVADLLLGLSLALLGLGLASLSPVTCRVNFHFTSTLQFISFFTITCMSGDRFLAMCMPFKYHRIAKEKRVKFLAVSLWIASVAFSLIFFAWEKPGASETPECNYIEEIGKDGYRFTAVLYMVVLLVNVAFFAGIVWALFLRKNSNDPLSSNGRENHMKEQKRIFLKILGILCLFLFTNVPGIIMTIVLGIDYDNRAKYATPLLAMALLGLSNSFFSPLVYVWRYPECRYMLLIYCNFWSQERQDRLRGEMNRYMASYNMASSGSGSAGNAMASTESNNPMGNEMHATNSDGLNGKVHDTCNILVDKSHSNEVVTCITDISRHSKDINQSEPTELNHKKKLYE